MERLQQSVLCWEGWGKDAGGGEVAAVGRGGMNHFEGARFPYSPCWKIKVCSEFASQM